MCIYIYNVCMYIQICLHTHTYIYIYQKNGGKVAQPRNTQLRHFVLAHPCSVQIAFYLLYLTIHIYIYSI